jgi:competence/damage-inducible protein CinA-like protein
MRCEVVAVGTELLLGQIVDTNSSWIGEQLALAGVDCLFQTKVGDNFGRIESAIRIALDRSDAVIVCGGLGPTQDDITRDVIARVMGVDLVRDPEIEDRIRSMFGSRGRFMPDNNLRQADVPVGAMVIPQMPGTAPGLICPVTVDGEDKLVYAVPGVPWEMQEMVAGTVIPELRSLMGETAVIRSRVLRTWGHSESGIAELLADRIVELDELGNPTLAFLASGVEGLKVRVTAKAPTEEEADRVLAEEVERLTPILADFVFSTRDWSMEQEVLELVRTQGRTLATAESVTGGLIAARLTDVPGASDVFRGSVVSYASDVKFDVLDVPEGPVVTEEAAVAMAEGACRVLGASCAVATTGVAGPDEQEGQRVGTVWLGICIDGRAEAHLVHLPGDRRRVRDFACISALHLLRARLLDHG